MGDDSQRIDAAFACGSGKRRPAGYDGWGAAGRSAFCWGFFKFAGVIEERPRLEEKPGDGCFVTSSLHYCGLRRERALAAKSTVMCE